MQVALYVDHRLLRIDTRRQIIHQYVLYVLVQQFRVGVGGERVNVGNEKITFILFLHPDEVTQGTVIVTQVQLTSRANSA